MRLTTPPASHLTYCTNIHPGETWPQVREALAGPVRQVKAAIAPDRPFGVGLRLSAAAAADLEDAAAFADLQALLADGGLYVFTVNGFPFGDFHGRRVKEQVYEPDWRARARRDYSDLLARQLAGLLPDGVAGSVSTVPGAFRPDVAGEADVAAMAENLLRHAAGLWWLAEETGRTVALAIEPEPACFMETTDEAIAFLQDRVFATAGCERFAGLTGVGAGEAEAALRRHVGVCFDVCHAAVEFEHPPTALAGLRAAGIGVPKVQLSSALRVPAVDRGAVERLRDYDEGIYLHQVVSRRDGRLTRYRDLADAFAAFDAGAEAGAEWRVHCHVPVFLDELDGFASTQADLVAAIDWLKRHGGTPHLEVETYTWGVLPERHRGGPIEDAIAREMAWTLERLAP